MKKTTIVASVLLTGIALAGAASTFAATSTGTTAIKNITSIAQKGGFKHEMGEGRGGPGGPMTQLTDAEKTAFEAMSDADKKTFMESKRAAAEAKRDAREAVIDKLLAGETLTDADKAIVTEIKTERAEHKAKEAEMKAKRDALKAALDKKAAGTTLTADEQALIDSMPQHGGMKQGEGKRGGFEGGKQGKGQRGQQSTTGQTSAIPNTSAVTQ